MGRAKRDLEDRVAKACDCDADIDLDIDRHAEGCPARAVIYEVLPDPTQEAGDE